MSSFKVGDRVRIDIPDTEDIDFEFHGMHAEVIMVFEDDAGEITGISEDAILYRVRLENSDKTVDLRGRDLRPPHHT